MEQSPYLAKARACLEAVQGTKLSVDERRQAAIELAALILHEARHTQTTEEAAHQSQLSRMMADPIGKVFTTFVADQCYRSSNPARAADQLIYNLHTFGIPRYLTWGQRFRFCLFKIFGPFLPKVFIPAIKKAMRQEASQVILPAEEPSLSGHLQRREKEGVRINLNHIGEAIIGEQEAKRRLEMYLKDLENPHINYISIKISTIYSQLNLLARKHTLDILKERLRQLYRKAMQNTFCTHNGVEMPKFINLDMEEYRDLHLTKDLFCEVLSEPEFKRFSAGIVLQSYLPDSYILQQELTEWALHRFSQGGAPVKIRIVKGANLAMEQVEASLRGWAQAPYLTKGEVDANYKRMIHYGCEALRAQAVNIGVGSHNLFDIAYAMLLRAEQGIERCVGFEMLEGMADPLRRTVQKLAGGMLLYCPVAAENEFQYALAYLIRRLDENTAAENFLHHAFAMIPGDKNWHHQAMLFSIACENADKVEFRPRRQQNRLQPQPRTDDYHPFENEPDTDWSLPANVLWAERLLQEWRHKKYPFIPLVINSQDFSPSSRKAMGRDPSFPDRILYEYALAEPADIDHALAAAVNAQRQWCGIRVEERSTKLMEIAHLLRCGRDRLIGSMVADTGKTIIEADAEVSEAIDFAEYYRRNLEELHCLQDIKWKAKGVVVVASPWNFPCSIPAGGILGALATGNAVIFKPAPEAVLVGWELVQLFWQAGIGKDVLQFINCEDDPVGSQLIQDPRVAMVILTGATQTAQQFQKMRPGLDLAAETGGKNAMIITAMADRDLAVKDLIQSAFGHAGQKCSACSLAICEAEVYDDLHFRATLRDAAASLRVGSPWDLSTKVNPLIKAPGELLRRGLTVLEEGEEWLLEPRQDADNPNLWSPGIKLGVKAGGFIHHTELFGPVLGLMRADTLQHAIELSNGTPYGLTAGLHSLDLREQEYWIKHIEAGNGYINRGITGAIVQRQPFGGCKASSFGRGAKAGGPNYLMQLMHAVQDSAPFERDTSACLGDIETTGWSESERSLWHASTGSYAFYWNHYFSKKHDPSRVVGQDNILSYIPHIRSVVRVDEQDAVIDIYRIIAAAMICDAMIEISCKAEKITWPKENKRVSLVVETDEQFVQRVQAGGFSRIRFLHKPEGSVAGAVAEKGCNAYVYPVLANGRLELLNYLRECVVSIDYHRYGYLGTRTLSR